MKNWSWLLISISLLVSASAHAQLYRWVGPDGKVTYSDTPPPSSAKQVEKKDVISGPATSNLPYELAQAVKNNPVTLYTTAKCAPCEDARAMLKARGIPYSEKTVNTYEEVIKFKQIAGDGDRQLPFLTVGSKKQRGFESNAWDAQLTAGGYPQSSQLPANYSNPTPESAAPAKPKATAPAPSTNDKATDAIPDSQPAAGNAPPGFRF